jgi:hypothetical protein
VAAEPVEDGQRRSAIAEFCREIETYLCRKNDGHLIRVTGPSFDLVADWAARGVPIKVAFKGIDRYFDRYYAKGPRRRPVKIDFCDADVLDVFDEWRRAVGVSIPRDGLKTVSYVPQDGEPSAAGDGLQAVAQRSASLPAHLERVVMRLTSARASGVLGESFDPLVDRVSRELDLARGDSRGLRGDARRALTDRLTALDGELLAHAQGLLDQAARSALAAEADEELRPFRAGMPAEAFARAREAAFNRLVRERFKLPTIAFE